MDVGPLFGLLFQSTFIGITMWILNIVIVIIIYGSMIEIYLVTFSDNSKYFSFKEEGKVMADIKLNMKS